MTPQGRCERCGLAWSEHGNAYIMNGCAMVPVECVSVRDLTPTHFLTTEKGRRMYQRMVRRAALAENKRRRERRKR